MNYLNYEEKFKGFPAGLKFFRWIDDIDKTYDTKFLYLINEYNESFWVIMDNYIGEVLGKRYDEVLEKFETVDDFKFLYDMVNAELILR